MTWDIAPACTVISQPYSCVDWTGEWKCPGCPAGWTFHAGIDISGPNVFRTPVYASRSGVVTAVGIQYLGDSAVAVHSDEGVTIEHGHLDQALVTVGQRVTVGDQLGLLGTKGNSTGPHLHVEVRVDGPFQGVAGCPQNDPTRNPVPYLRASSMIAGLDSSFYRPSAAQARQAKTAGVSLWSGYLATKPNVGLASPWTKADFDNARLCGAKPIAFCSGNDDPAACRDLAAQWDVRLCLDVESGIRGDGPWIQAWLDASGAGLYGNAPVMLGRRAAFYVLAAYPGQDPGKVWPLTLDRPDQPVGWQWQGSHDELGGSVDRGWYEDWFLTEGERDLQPDEREALLYSVRMLQNLYNWNLYGADGVVGPSYSASQLKPALDQLPSRTDLKVALAGIAPTVTLDEDKLAAAIVAKLPAGAGTLDEKSAATLAKAVVDEIGTRVRPAA